MPFTASGLQTAHTGRNVLQEHFWLPPCKGFTMRPKHPVISSFWVFPSCLCWAFSLRCSVASFWTNLVVCAVCGSWLIPFSWAQALLWFLSLFTLLAPVFLDHSVIQGLICVPPSPWLLYPDIMFCCYICSHYPGSLVAQISSSFAEECWWMRKGINEQTSIFASDI